MKPIQILLKVQYTKSLEENVDRKIEDLCQAEYRALLDTIAHAKGTDDNYNIMFGGNSFKNSSDHPVKTGEMPEKGLPFKNNFSTAAGRYQFILKTYDVLKRKGMFDNFSPEEQGKAAIYLAKNRRKVSLELLKNAVKTKNFKPVWKRLNQEWASIPTTTGKGRYEHLGNQKAKRDRELAQVFLNSYQEHKKMGY